MICKDFQNKNKFIELPCNVGDTVYAIINTMSLPKAIYECKVFNLVITVYGIVSVLNARVGDAIYGNVVVDCENVFSTYEQAEQKLKEINENDKI